MLDRFLNATRWRHHASQRSWSGCLLALQLMELIEQNPFDLSDPCLFNVTGRCLEDPNFMTTCVIDTIPFISHYEDDDGEMMNWN